MCTEILRKDDPQQVCLHSNSLNMCGQPILAFLVRGTSMASGASGRTEKYIVHACSRRRRGS